MAWKNETGQDKQTDYIGTECDRKLPKLQNTVFPPETFIESCCLVDGVGGVLVVLAFVHVPRPARRLLLLCHLGAGG